MYSAILLTCTLTAEHDDGSKKNKLFCEKKNLKYFRCNIEPLFVDTKVPLGDLVAPLCVTLVNQIEKSSPAVNRRLF